jgi:hypothetical protein
MQTRSETLHFEIHKLINSVSNKENFLGSEGVIAPIYNKSDRTVISNYLGMSLISRIQVFNIPLSRLALYADEVIVDRQWWTSTQQIKRLLRYSTSESGVYTRRPFHGSGG